MGERTDILQREQDAHAASDAAYEAAKADWEAISGQYITMRGGAAGDGVDRIAALVRRFGPKLMMSMGLPGAAGGLTALVADEGAFGGILGTLKSLLGFVF